MQWLIPMRKTFTGDKCNITGQLYYVRESSTGSAGLNNGLSLHVSRLTFTSLICFHANLNWATLLAQFVWIIYATGVSVYKAVSSSQTMSGIGSDRSLVHRLHALRNWLTFELSGGVNPTLFGVLWDDFKRSTCIQCNRTNAGIQFSCVHLNTQENDTPVVRLDVRSKHQAGICCLITWSLSYLS